MSVIRIWYFMFDPFVRVLLLNRSEDRLSHSFVALTRSFNDLSQLVNKCRRTPTPTLK